MAESIRYVVDTSGIRYVLGEELGRGGQGAVYSTEGGRLAVKLLFDRSPVRRDRLRNQLALVGRLPLEGLPLARPLRMLRSPEVGYVMELLTGMVPLIELIRPPKSAASILSWFVATGGLRRRLRLLGRIADVMAQLHGRSLAYGDPSPHNVFVSRATDVTEVRLIDADNLQYQSSPSATPIFTPGYGAPELLACRSGANTLTDAHAFAVMAFQVLSLVHPLLGDAVTEGEPEKEEQALRGVLPWIDDPTDTSNSSKHGWPRAEVLSDSLAKLFARTFGEGLRSPLSRPGLAEWAERLHAAADAALRCSACGWSYYLRRANCPQCDNPRPQYVLGVFHLWDPSLEPQGGVVRQPRSEGGKPVVAAAVTITDSDPLEIGERLHGTPSNNQGPGQLRIEKDGQRLVLHNTTQQRFRLISPTGAQIRELGAEPVPIRCEPGRASWQLHLGAADKLHRVVSFELRGDTEHAG